MKGKTNKVKPKNRRPKNSNAVSAKVLKFWNSKAQWGDATKIQKQTNLSRPTIKQAFEGHASEELVELITNFYLKQTTSPKSKPEQKQEVGRPVTTIIVPNDTLKYWHDNYHTGDLTKISNKKKVSRVTIRRAWNEGRASKENIRKITAFYDERKKKQQNVETKIKQASLGEA